MIPDKPTKRPPVRRGQQAAVSARAEVNRTRALELRIAGQTCRQIGAALGVSHGTAADYVNAALVRERESQTEQAAVWRELELARLDALTVRMMAFVRRVDVIIETEREGARGPVRITVEDYAAATRAAELVVKISARRAALLGLDAPTRSEHTGREGEPLLAGGLGDALLKAYGQRV